MKTIYDLPEIDFVEINAEKIEAEAVTFLEEELGKELYPASPERLLLLSLLSIIIQDRHLINDTGKQNLLKFSRGNFLENLGATMQEERSQSLFAFTTLKFKISTTLNKVHVIPKGTRATPDGTIYFATDEDIEMQPGETEVEVQATCLTPGLIGNEFVPGQIKEIVDPFPYFESVTNVTESYGGLDEESDDQLREKIHESPEKLSTAGPDGAYMYYARKSSPLIEDVSVHSPSPGVVRLTPLLVDGDIPTDEIINKVYETCNYRKVRPLTDKLEVLKPDIVEYDLDVEYWIGEENKPFVNQINTNIMKLIEEFEIWQKRKLGRDINPSKLISVMVQAGAKRVNVNSPVFSKLENNKVAYLRTKNIVYKGVESD